MSMHVFTHFDGSNAKYPNWTNLCTTLIAVNLEIYIVEGYAFKGKTMLILLEN